MIKKIDIIEKSLHDSALFLKNLNTSKHFETIIQKYKIMHNKGIFIDFSFNSSNAVSMFEHYKRRHNVSDNILDDINPIFSRNKKMECNKLTTNLERNKNKLDINLRNVQEIKNFFHTQTDKRLEITTHMNTAPTISEMKVAFEKRQTVTFGKGLILYEVESLKKQINDHSQVIKTIKRIERDQRSISKAINNAELILFKTTLKFFMKNMQQQLRMLFNNQSLYINYSLKNWVELYEKDKQKYTVDKFEEYQFTTFEEKIMNIINVHKYNFFTVVSTDQNKYLFSRKSLNIQLKKQPTNKEKKLVSLLNEYTLFQNNNKELILLTDTLYDIKEKFSKESNLYQQFLRYVFKHFPAETINKYNYFLENLKESRNDMNEEESSKSIFTPINTAFPFLQFEIKQEKDMEYWFLLKKEKFVELLCNVSNDTHFFTFEKTI